MTRRRWIADRVSGNRAFLTGAHAAHLTRVLRARIGQEFDIAADNRIRRGRITSIDSQQVELELGEEIPSPSSPRVRLALAIFKFDRMEWAIEKCAELGASQIVPVIAHRTEPRLASAAGKRVERWRRIVRQAAEQSRQVQPPEILAPIKLEEAAALPGSTRILLAEGEKEITLLAALPSASTDSDVVLALGPEGGWTDREVEIFRAAGWLPASLGNAILRAETAAIAATAIVLSRLAR
ncbi:MAG TPA: 16S rRNA (uracil(1498)-N(3))-methyltransferase [Terriglobales bacterium]|nr:16S rRNA (uracil(1498)-N(3))-methyltransferase [Terriglobales bacterium]